MEVYQRTGGRIRRQISLEPLLLDAARLASANLRAFAIEHDNMPGTQIVRVIAFAADGAIGVQWRGSRAKVRVVAARSRRIAAGGFVLVVADCWPRDGFHLAPTDVVGKLEL